MIYIYIDIYIYQEKQCILNEKSVIISKLKVFSINSQARPGLIAYGVAAGRSRNLAFFSAVVRDLAAKNIDGG
jgi:hypothetical protein